MNNKDNQSDQLQADYRALQEELSLAKTMLELLRHENKKLREALSLIEMANCYTDYEDAVSIAREALEEVGDK